MMSGRKLTMYFMGAIIAIIAVYDVWVLIAFGGDATISRIVYGWSTVSPFGFLIGFAIGFLCGHLFWAQKVTGER
jgi:hypothetical protein